MHTFATPEEIEPLHPARDRGKLRNLVREMKRDGWKGRPLLVIEAGGKLTAWTGSHRIAAARIVQLDEVPCYVVAEAEILPFGVTASIGHVEDWERLEIIRKAGDEEAAHLMWQEGRDN